MSDSPHIFSHHFYFKFDVHHALGYIVPEWIDSMDDIPEDVKPDWTHIYLPLKDQCEFQADELFDGIDTVLLFLHKLRKLEIEHGDKSLYKTIMKEEVGEHRWQVKVLSRDENSFSFSRKIPVSSYLFLRWLRNLPIVLPPKISVISSTVKNFRFPKVFKLNSAKRKRRKLFSRFLSKNAIPMDLIQCTPFYRCRPWDFGSSYKPTST